MRISKTWGTHLPVLIKVMKETNGDVLELGTGLYSTPFLHWVCYPTKRKLVSYDNNSEILKYMSQYQDNNFHEVNEIEDWDKIDIEKPWDVVLIDHSPDIRRGIETKRLANFAKYIVLHDSDPRNDSAYKYDEMYPLFKYRFDFNEVRPHTTVLSNFIDLTNFKI